MDAVRIGYAQWSMARYQQLGRVKAFAHNRNGVIDSVELEVFWNHIPNGMDVAMLCEKIKFRSPMGY